MNRTIGIILIVVGLVLGYLGIQKMDNSKAGIEIGNVEISAKSESKSNAAIIYLVLGGVCLVGGIVMAGRKN